MKLKSAGRGRSAFVTRGLQSRPVFDDHVVFVKPRHTKTVSRQFAHTAPNQLRRAAPPPPPHHYRKSASHPHPARKCNPPRRPCAQRQQPRQRLGYRLGREPEGPEVHRNHPPRAQVEKPSAAHPRDWCALRESCPDYKRRSATGRSQEQAAVQSRRNLKNTPCLRSGTPCGRHRAEHIRQSRDRCR